VGLPYLHGQPSTAAATTRHRSRHRETGSDRIVWLTCQHFAPALFVFLRGFFHRRGILVGVNRAHSIDDSHGSLHSGVIDDFNVEGIAAFEKQADGR
jgi:hypothetical protein